MKLPNSLPIGLSAGSPNTTRQCWLKAALLLGCAWLLASCATPQQTPPPQATKKALPVSAKVLVVYYSHTGNTEKLAHGVMEGIAKVPNVEGVLRKVESTTSSDLASAQGIILGCPAYFGNLPGPMKTAMDDWNWKWKVDFTDKIGGAFATGGGQTGGKEHTVVSLLIFMLQNRMMVAGPLYGNEKTGSVWGELGASAMTGPLDPGVSEAELDGARRLGERIGRLVLNPASK